MLNLSFVFTGYINGRPYWTSTEYNMEIIWNGTFWEILNWPYDGLPINYTDTDIPITGWQLIDNTSITATFTVNLGECCFDYLYLNNIPESTLVIEYIDCNYENQAIVAEFGASGSFCATSISYASNPELYSTSGSICVPSPSPSITPSISISATPSVTPSVTPSITPSITPSTSTGVSVTPSVTPSLSIEVSITPSITATPSITPSITPTNTPTNTPTPTPTSTPLDFNICTSWNIFNPGPASINWSGLICSSGNPTSGTVSAGQTIVTGCIVDGTLNYTGSPTVTVNQIC